MALRHAPAPTAGPSLQLLFAGLAVVAVSAGLISTLVLTALHPAFGGPSDPVAHPTSTPSPTHRRSRHRRRPP